MSDRKVYDCEKPLCMSRIAALKAENAKLRAVVDIAKHYVRCYNIGDCMAEGNAWIDLQDIVNKMETMDE